MRIFNKLPQINPMKIVGYRLKKIMMTLLMEENLEDQ